MTVGVRIGEDELELSWEEWEERARAGRIPAYALVRFEPVTGSEWRRAAELEMYTSLCSEATLAWQRRFTVSPPPLLTALLVGVQLRLWWMARIPEVRSWMLWRLTNWAPPTLEDGESWRLLTHGLVQIEPLHLGMNMLWLAYTGWNLERALGRANLAVLFAASVLGGGLLSMFASPETPSLGSSGGVFGLMAASVVFGFHRPDLLPRRGWRLFGMAMLPYTLVMLYSGFSSESTDNWSHVGGLLTGAALVLFLDPDPLQRRAGWNRTVQGVTLTLMALILVTLGLLGPRLDPLVSAEAALLRGRAPVTAVEGAPSSPERGLRYAVPLGWSRGATLARDLAWVSPASSAPIPSDDPVRAFSVEEVSRSTPVHAEALAAEWAHALQRAWPEAEVDPPAWIERFGGPTLRTRARVEGEVTRELTLWIRPRGTTALQVVWEVDATRAERLAPLRERLLARVSWPEPAELLLAKEQVERNPGGVRGRADLARALARAGEAEESLALWEALVQEHPGREDLWLGLLHTSTWYPEQRPDPRPLWARALAAQASPPVIVAVVEDMEAHDQPALARGLLDLAWIRSPGDRSLARARTSRSLSTALDEEQAWIWTRELLHGEPRRDLPEVLPPLDLEEAARWDAQQEEARARLATTMIASLDRGDAVDPDALLRLRERGAPRDRVRASRALARDLRDHLDGEPLPWLPEGAKLRGALVQSLARGALLPCEQGGGWCPASSPD